MTPLHADARVLSSAIEKENGAFSFLLSKTFLGDCGGWQSSSKLRIWRYLTAILFKTPRISSNRKNQNRAIILTKATFSAWPWRYHRIGFFQSVGTDFNVAKNDRDGEVFLLGKTLREKKKGAIIFTSHLLCLAVKCEKYCTLSGLCAVSKTQIRDLSTDVLGRQRGTTFTLESSPTQPVGKDFDVAKMIRTGRYSFWETITSGQPPGPLWGGVFFLRYENACGVNPLHMWETDSFSRFYIFANLWPSYASVHVPPAFSVCVIRITDPF